MGFFWKIAEKRMKKQIIRINGEKNTKKYDKMNFSTDQMHS